MIYGGGGNEKRLNLNKFWVICEEYILISVWEIFIGFSHYNKVLHNSSFVDKLLYMTNTNLPKVKKRLRNTPRNNQVISINARIHITRVS